MMRGLTYIDILLWLILWVPLSASGEDALPSKVERFLHSRQIVGTIHFADGSSVLSSEAKTEIDRIIPRLRKVDPDESLLRIEGFASPGGGPGKNVPISMDRAMAVVDYIQSKSSVQADLFLTGFGAQEATSISNEQSCRAEIALYNNIWKTSDVTIEKVIQR